MKDLVLNLDFNMKISDFNFPIWLVNSEMSSCEKVYRLEHLEKVPYLVIKEHSLTNAFLVDFNRIYQIIFVKDLGNVNSKWKFEFFNPMRKIEIKLEIISNKEITEKLYKLINEQNEEDRINQGIE